MTTKTLTGFRFVEIHQDDTLQEIAARELQDASRWAELISINELTYPYLTGDPAQAGDGVKLYGQLILVPSATAQVSATADPDTVYGVDLRLNRGKLSLDGGDIMLVHGRANLRQALENRIATDKRELIFHLDYGCDIRKLLGTINGPTAGMLAARYVKAAVMSDERIDNVISSTADVSGDVVAVTAKAVPISGKPIDLTMTL